MLIREAFVLISVCLAITSASYGTVYMSQECGGTHYLNDADYISYSPYGYTAGECTLTIDVSIDPYYIILNFENLDASVFDTIDVFDGPTTSYRQLNGEAISGVDESPNYRFKSSASQLTIRFNSLSGSLSNTGFRAVVTQADDMFCSIEYSCCDGGCIDNILRSDGVENCKDGSDEWDVTGCLNTDGLIAVVVGVAAGFLCLVWLFCCCLTCTKRRRARRRQGIRQPVLIRSSYAQNYGSSYIQQPATIYQHYPSGNIAQTTVVPGSQPPPYFPPPYQPPVHQPATSSTTNQSASATSSTNNQSESKNKGEQK